MVSKKQLEIEIKELMARLAGEKAFTEYQSMMLSESLKKTFVHLTTENQKLNALVGNNSGQLQ